MFYKSIFYENIRLVSRIDLFISITLFKIYYLINKKTLYDVDIEIKNNSIKITDKIFKKIKNFFNDKDVFVINCSQDKRYPFNQWSKIALNNEMIPLKIFNSFKYSDNVFYKDGGHFNEFVE